MAFTRLAILGYGAIGQALVGKLVEADLNNVLRAIIVRPQHCDAIRQTVPIPCRVMSEVPEDCDLLIECAGHEAVTRVVPNALRQGIEVAIVSTGALVDAELRKELESSASHGKTFLHLLPGAIGGIDALAAARHAGLSSVVYRGRKPPAAWQGTQVEKLIDLGKLKEPTTFFSGLARDVVARYPKNANVAATVSLAGLGFDKTRVELIADPTIKENSHELLAEGTFGRLEIKLGIEPLESNPKTSALTVLSALRFIQSKQFGLVV